MTNPELAKLVQAKIVEMTNANPKVQSPLDGKGVEVREGLLYVNFYGHGLWFDGEATLKKLESINVLNPNQFDRTCYHAIKTSFIPGDAPEWAKAQAQALFNQVEERV